MTMLQGTSPLSRTKDIESQQSIEGPVPASKRINGIVGLLLLIELLGSECRS